MVVLAQVWNAGGSELVTVSFDSVVVAGSLPTPVVVLEIADSRVLLDGDGTRQLAALLTQAAAVAAVSSGVQQVTAQRSKGGPKQ